VPDLAVYLDMHGSTDMEEIANRLENALAPGGVSLQTARRVDRHVAAVNVLKPFSFAPGQPYQGRDSWLMLDGALFEAPLERDGRPGSPERCLASLAACLASGNRKRLSSLNGQFNAALYHPQEKRLVLVTDRLGSRPLYYYREGDRHIIASEMKAILAALGRTVDVDPLGVLELFTFSHNIGKRTVLRGIEVLPPGSLFTVDEKGMRCSGYFEFRYSVEKERSRPAVLGARITECVQEVVPRFLEGPGRKGIFLSGGLDSRIVAGAIDSKRFPMNAFTFGYPESRDVRFAAVLAGILGFRHRVLTYPDVYLSSVIREVVSRSECAAPFYHATSVLFHDEVAQEADVILVGFCGDVFSGGHLRPAMFRASPGPALTDMIFQRALCAGPGDLRRVFRREFFMPLWPPLVDSFRSSVEEIGEQCGPDVADVWDVRNRQRRFTFSAPKVDRGRFEVLAPLLDNRFMDLILTLPPSVRRRQAAYKHAIVTAYPDLRRVPSTGTGCPIPLNPVLEKMQEACDKGSRILRMALRRVGLGSTGALGWQFRNVGEEIRRDPDLFHHHLFPFMEGERFPEDLFDRERILNLVKDHQQGRVDASHLLGTLVTVAVFLELCPRWAEG